MSEELLLNKLKKCVVEGRDQEAKDAAKEAIKAGIDPLVIIGKHLNVAMKEVGDKFESGEYFLTDLMLAAEAMKSAGDVLLSEMSAESRCEMEAKKMGTVAIGTVRGDIHDLGKSIVTSILVANGFSVHDLGKDLNSQEIIRQAVDLKVDIIALCALMTTTMPNMEEVIKSLREMGLREKFKVMVGGAPTTQAWADRIGADGWGPDAASAVAVAKSLVSKQWSTHKQ